MRSAPGRFPTQLMQRRHSHAVAWNGRDVSQDPIGSKVTAVSLAGTVNISLLGTSRMGANGANDIRKVNAIESCGDRSVQTDIVGHPSQLQHGITIGSARRCMRERVRPGQVDNLIVNSARNLFEQSRQSRKV